jgi:hypothetical protein
VERYCKEAGDIAGFQLDDDTLAQVVKLMGADADYEITLQGLKHTVLTIRNSFLESVVEQSNQHGRREAGLRLKTFFDSRVDNSMLPAG